MWSCTTVLSCIRGHHIYSHPVADKAYGVATHSYLRKVGIYGVFYLFVIVGIRVHGFIWYL